MGGRTKIIEQDGFKFDRGPTFFHYPEVIEEIFQAIGLDAHKELGLIPLDPSYKLIFGQGGSIEATSDLDEMTERVRELSGDENAEGFQSTSRKTGVNYYEASPAFSRLGRGHLIF